MEGERHEKRLQGKVYRDQEAMVKKGTRILDTMRKTKAGTPSDLIFNLIYCQPVFILVLHILACFPQKVEEGKEFVFLLC